MVLLARNLPLQFDVARSKLQVRRNTQSSEAPSCTFERSHLNTFGHFDRYICLAQLPPTSLSDGWRYRGPVCGVLVFWLQIVIEPLFHHSEYVLMCFTVMFQR